MPSMVRRGSRVRVPTSAFLQGAAMTHGLSPRRRTARSTLVERVRDTTFARPREMR
jgi:hypothetical protein